MDEKKLDAGKKEKKKTYTIIDKRRLYQINCDFFLSLPLGESYLPTTTLHNWLNTEGLRCTAAESPNIKKKNKIWK